VRGKVKSMGELLQAMVILAILIDLLWMGLAPAPLADLGLFSCSLILANKPTAL
jgi:hypothetical protein